MDFLLRRRGAALAFVALVSVLVHLKGLTAPPYDYHYHRQVNTASIARTYHREARPLVRPGVDWEGHSSPCSHIMTGSSVAAMPRLGPSQSTPGRTSGRASRW
jgi:hypothetical protein